ncbi:DUF5700 domain-containing putative Zn-dependent protease [Spirosoma oryzicola]|uniref:DUF5700 domain-containing putative Zn-dependent protease n=1 Tax=Spirosoma oryzicola TaxID=2898794 RepID=UPI001E4AEFEC|nr:DUF5700 domain-containing putative Zn-dependent protease [Spirosoma oryzicola]UHG94743.1 hypothetical protein LQ777_28800 [Spirosoma oryzicola]
MKVLMLFFTLSIGLSSALAQTLVDSTCKRYFAITDQLRQGDTLDPKVWNQLMNDKAIQMYIRDQGVDEGYIERYKRTMQLVYMPQNEALLQSRLKDSTKYWLTYILYQYKKNEAGMRAYLTNLEKDPAKYFNDCYRYTYAMLPKSAQKRATNQIYSIIPIHYDAHAENDYIVCSLLCAYLNDKNQYGVLGGHELHHILRPRIDYTKITSEDENVVALLEITLNEGSADMIDKKYMTNKDTVLLPFQRYFNTFFEEGKHLLPQIDSLLQLSAKGSTFTVRQFLKGTIFTGGHVPGTYMAHYIEKNQLTSKLVARINDPFHFYLLYNEAARKDPSKPYVFSKASVGYITRLRKKYSAALYSH